ncbi:hypothetical protein HYH03_002628 [Edaphochlamys debaryana]|uniref:CBS domain-containing protein n=1 Tax=Edaphochlamys debaryana TaxID=47281 RepID=A0A836C576_9CHLO|nr:hypothetical protein HYH03_002628 [Edaphochlamys debaryana]|eukprot:KAG2499693.1 hypothetical protein HYH03_002628 [Edaphochlamys debaryana]
MASLSGMLGSASALLEQTPLSKLIPTNQAVLYLEHNSTVGVALQMLARRHILSAPLVIVPGLEDMEGGDNDSGADRPPQLIGWVTVESILRAFLQHMEEKHGKLSRNMLLLMTQLEKEGPAFAEKPLITVAGSEDRGLMFQVHSDVSVLEALRESFAPSGKPAAHRLAVFDASGAITAVVSQLDVIRYLHENPQLLGDLAGATVEQLGWVPPPPSSSAPPSPGVAPPGSARPLVTVDASLPALLAYERMARAGVSGAPVVADAEAAVGSSGAGSTSGCLIANLSMSDLRNIQSQHLGILALPVGEFLALLHNTSYLGYSQRTSQQAGHPFFASGPATVAPPPRLGSSPGTREDRSILNRASTGSAHSGMGGGGGGAAPMDMGDGAGAGGEGDTIRMITCSGSDTLAKVLALLSDNRVHRVYVGAAGSGPLVKPVSVITPTDILRLLAGTARK